MTEIILAYDRTPKNVSEYIFDRRQVLDLLPHVRAIKFGKESMSCRLRIPDVPSTSAAWAISGAINQRIGGMVFWDDKLLDIGRWIATSPHFDIIIHSTRSRNARSKGRRVWWICQSPAEGREYAIRGRTGG